jgi:hypothetical protein
MGIKFELVAKAGTYEKNGETKTRYHTCGIVLERADGSLSAKIESLPVGFDGWLNLWEPKPRDGTAPKPAAAKGKKVDPEDDGQIPF